MTETARKSLPQDVFNTFLKEKYPQSASILVYAPFPTSFDNAEGEELEKLLADLPDVTRKPEHRPVSDLITVIAPKLLGTIWTSTVHYTSSSQSLEEWHEECDTVENFTLALLENSIERFSQIAAAYAFTVKTALEEGEESTVLKLDPLFVGHIRGALLVRAHTELDLLIDTLAPSLQLDLGDAVGMGIGILEAYADRLAVFLEMTGDKMEDADREHYRRMLDTLNTQAHAIARGELPSVDAGPDHADVKIIEKELEAQLAAAASASLNTETLH